MMTNPTVLEVVMNFIAIVIVSDFDNYLFIASQKDPLGKLIKDGEFDFAYLEGDENKRELSDVTKIEVTTSSFARFRVTGNRLEQDKEAGAQGEGARDQNGGE